MSTVKYALLIKGGEITVRKYDAEIDYAAEVEQTFRKFQQGAVKDYNAKFSDWPQMNHIEAAVLDRVAQAVSRDIRALGRLLPAERELSRRDYWRL